MGSTSKADQQLRDEVTYVKVSIDQVIAPAVKEMQETLRSMSVITKVDYANDQEKLRIANKERDDTIAALKDELTAHKNETAGVLRLYNFVTSKVTQIIFFVIVVVILIVIAPQLLKFIGVSA